MTTIQVKVPNWLDLIFVWPVLLYRQWKYGYWFRKIFIGDGRYTIVEPTDYYRLNNFHWYAEGQDIHIYAVRNIIKPGCKSRSMRLSREIMDAPAGLLVDHRNNNTLDNRRANLRLATSSQNLSNRRINKSKSSSQFRGVRFRKERGCWSAQITCNGKAIWLGSFDSETDAAKAYDTAAKKYFGEFSRLNLPQK